MRIDASSTTPVSYPFPAQAARAYGVMKARPATAPAAPAPIEPSRQPSPTDHARPSLVAGQVSKPVDFDAAPVPPGQMPSLQLYTRAADRVEAAIGVHIGRTLDVRG